MANLKVSELDVHESDFQLRWNMTTFLNEYFAAKVYISFHYVIVQVKFCVCIVVCRLGMNAS